MSDNLIYGKTVADFGALGNGIADDTKAFTDAFSSGESLICIPFGSYIIKEPICLKSGVTVLAHPKAVINFKSLNFVQNAKSVNVSGGIWNFSDTDKCAVSLPSCTDIVIENACFECDTASVILVNAGKNILFENITIKSQGGTSAVVFDGKSDTVKFKKINFSKCSAAIELSRSASISAFYADALVSEKCGYMLKAAGAEISCSVISDISGDFENDAIYFEDSKITDTSIRHIHTSDGYIHFDKSELCGLKISDFVRVLEVETCTSKPSFVANKCKNHTEIFDGIQLDAIILAKKSVPDTKMTAAKMASVTPAVYSYTLELPVSSSDTFIIPTGSFKSAMFF